MSRHEQNDIIIYGNSGFLPRSRKCSCQPCFIGSPHLCGCRQILLPSSQQEFFKPTSTAPKLGCRNSEPPYVGSYHYESCHKACLLAPRFAPVLSIDLHG